MRPQAAKIVYLAAFLILGSYAFFVLRGPKGIPGLLAKQREIRVMEQRNAALAQDNERARERIERLTGDPAQQELEIRQRLKLVRPGEKVYILNNK
jgi:cell division protein FtsB